MTNLRISLLGTPAILVDNRPFDTDRRKAIALLAYLIVTGKPQPRHQLATFFWPEYDRESAFAYLRRTLYELNKGLGTGWLVTDRDNAAFNQTEDATIDTVAFESELATALVDEDPAPHLEAAAAQYKGEFLAGFYLQDTESFDDWLRQQRETYQGYYARALERLATIYERLGPWDEALKHAQTWLALDDLNEAAHRAIMRIYARMGERSKAIRQYETCIQVLRDAIKVKPQPETTALYERIRDGSFEGMKQPVEPQAEVKAAPGSSLPILTTPFIGRRQEIEQIKELILNPDNRLVTLLGPGGIGKTRLSIQAASEICDQFPDGVWFVPLAAVQSPEGLFPAVAKTLNFSFYREGSPKQEQLLQYLQNKQLLIILDNVDHLSSRETADLLIKILTGAEGAKLLATSRVRLNIQAEQVYLVPGMQTPTAEEASAWKDPESLAKPFSAVQLFLDRARRSQPGFTLKTENVAVVVEICQMVSGMPLGLELAASWLELLPPEGILAEIRRSLDFLETDQPDVPDRQRSIRAVFDYSWKLLDEGEREVFLALSVFTGSFTREAAQQVSNAGLRTLLSLANKSWLQQVSGGRFQLHPLLQHYGFEKLRQDEKTWHNTSNRHAAYFADFVAQQSKRMHGAEQLAAVEELSEEFDTNIKAAWDRLVAQEQWVEIREKMAIGLFQFGMIRWRGDEIIEMLRSARIKLEGGSGSEVNLTRADLGIAEIYFEEMWAYKENRPDVRLAALWNLVEQEDLAERMGLWFVMLGKIYANRHHAPWVEEKVDAAIEHLRSLGDPWLLGSALLLQSYQWGQFPSGGSLDKVSRALQEALGIFKDLGTIYEQAQIFNSMAEIAVHRKIPVEEVVELLRQAQQFYFKMNDLVAMGMVNWNLGNLYFLRGRAEEGFVTYQEMQRIFDQLGNQRMVGLSLSWESIWAARYSTFEHALETRQRSAEHSQKYWSQTVYAWDLLEMGDIYRIFGYKKKALEYYEIAQLNCKRINLTLGLGYHQRGLGAIAMEEKRYGDALKHFQEYKAYADEDNHEWSIAQASLGMAWAYAHLGEIKQSRKWIYNCISRLINTDEVGLELTALLCEARCLVEEGKNQAAVALAAFVKGHPITWNETRFYAKALLSNLAEKLSDEAYQEACRRVPILEPRELTSKWLAEYAANEELNPTASP